MVVECVWLWLGVVVECVCEGWVVECECEGVWV